MSYQTTGAIGGAVQGASAGMAFGPVGAVVGGAIGAISGFVGGGAADDAARHVRKAKKRERQMSLQAAWVERRDMIRNARIQAAQQQAVIAASGEGGFLSSAPLGAMASLTSQSVFNQRYFAKRINDFLFIQKHMDKAGKSAQNAANTQSYMDIAASASSLFAPKSVTSSQLPSMGYGTGEQYGRTATSKIDPSTGFAWEG